MGVAWLLSRRAHLRRHNGPGWDTDGMGTMPVVGQRNVGKRVHHEVVGHEFRVSGFPPDAVPGGSA
jgi:hypothetical protein